jgi:tol-pal system protein YbgF
LSGSGAARHRLAALAVAVLVAGGCASAPRLPETPGARRSAEIEELQARVLQLAQQAAVAESEIARLRQQVASLEARVGGATARPGGSAAARPSTPATPGVAAAPRPTPAPARPASTPAPSRPAPAPIEEDDLAVEEVEVIAPPPRQPAAAPAPARPAGGAASAAAGPLGAVPREAQAVYDEAYTLYHQGQYDQSEARFQEFLAVAPSTELSDNAQYWIGAARYARGDFRGALAAFRRTVESYPEENKVPDALFKMGQALEELGDPAEALTVYAELVQRFPDTAAATLAAERQSKLR